MLGLVWPLKWQEMFSRRGIILQTNRSCFVSHASCATVARSLPGQEKSEPGRKLIFSDNVKFGVVLFVRANFHSLTLRAGRRAEAEKNEYTNLLTPVRAGWLAGC